MASLVASFAYFRFGREVSLPVNRRLACFRIADSIDIVLDHGRAIWFGRKLDDRCIRYDAALPRKRAADRIELG
jgi:hypothetical protein